jgi:small subunit ribosomal protein S20
MAHLHATKKDLRQARTRAEANRLVKSRMKTVVKKVVAAIEGGDKAGAEKALREAMSALDRAAKTNVIHKNAASRKKSRLAKRLAKLTKKA